MPETPVLEASELTKVYRMPRKGSSSLRQQVFKAVDNVSLQLFAGATAALVGQSGPESPLSSDCCPGWTGRPAV